MRVLHICSYYIGSKFYQKMFDSLDRRNIKQDIYVFTGHEQGTDSDYKENIYISKCYNKFDRVIFHLKHSKVLKDIKDKMEIEEYDIMHAHSLFSNGYVAYKLNQLYDIPYIVAVRNTDVNLFFSKMLYLRKLGVNILKNAEKIVFISEPYRKHTIDKYIPKKYKKEIERKSTVIPNGIDEFWINNKLENGVTPKEKTIRIIYVGSVDKNKNIETTTKACELLIKQGYEVEYKIIGKVMNEDYESFIKRHDFIEYISYCEKEKLIDHYRNSDIFVMPSKHETFGLVYAEAMSQGLPIIYTRNQGFDGQFEEGEVGYSVDYDLPEEIVKKVKYILDNYKNISNVCINKVDKFNWDNIIREYINIYSVIYKRVENINDR